MNFPKRLVDYVRRSYCQETSISHLLCSICPSELPGDDEKSFRVYVNLEKNGYVAEEGMNHAYQCNTTKTLQETQQSDLPCKCNVWDDSEDEGDVAQATSDASSERTLVERSLPADRQPGPSPPPAAGICSCARVVGPGDNFKQGPKIPSGRQLWTDGDGTKALQEVSVSAASSTVTRQPPSNATSRPPQPDSYDNETEPVIQMIHQPGNRPISQDQLVAEVKGLYAGVVMAETKCIEVDNAQRLNTDANKLNDEEWKALIALHRTLLHEHHDFFLASQHPSASKALSGLASKYAMAARMWRHGIHSFLELLRHRLPASREHMLTFLYLAYSMMALLYETVPAFGDTWIECLGDLSRYRMAIEDDDIKDREVWTGVSQHWYSKASNKSPNTGRLYHHLAILARSNALQQLYYYAKSLCVPTPFLTSRESVMTLFNPILDSDPRHLSEVDTNFVRVHGILFSGRGDENKLKASMEKFLTILDSKIAGLTKKWLEAGYFMGIATCCSLLGYGNESNVLMKALSQQPDETDVTMGNSVLVVPPSESFKTALEFAVKTYEIVVLRWGDTNTLPFVHTMMVLIHKLAQYPAAISYLEQVFPWKLTMVMLNYHLESCDFEPRMDGDFPGPEKHEAPRPLPEDYAMRGLIYVDDYYPKEWFTNEKIDEDKRYFELASMVDQRKERILYLGYKIAAHNRWLRFDTESRRFSVADEYDVDLGTISPLLEPEELKKGQDFVLKEDEVGKGYDRRIVITKSLKRTRWAGQTRSWGTFLGFLLDAVFLDSRLLTVAHS
ncbi:hypothetical protein BKA56DRAFT_243701 [Ilyonectria sp. MPI-CAGE-AT-0026]|nr:hypothetical protein BKA56DRAFT_243701 [Ilyonectria sp. MPI-CAGE-AT-0026]